MTDLDKNTSNLQQLSTGTGLAIGGCALGISLLLSSIILAYGMNRVTDKITEATKIKLQIEPFDFNSKLQINEDPNNPQVNIKGYYNNYEYEGGIKTNNSAGEVEIFGNVKDKKP